MGERIYTAEDAEALAAAATPGPWTSLPLYGVSFDATRGVVSLTVAEEDSDLMIAAHDLARSVAHHARRAQALEAETARLRAVIAAERGIAAPEGWQVRDPGWLHLGDDEGHLDRYVWPDGRDNSAGKDRREGTWWGWLVDELVDGRLICSRRGFAPTALEAMEAADAAAEAARG